MGPWCKRMAGSSKFAFLRADCRGLKWLGEEDSNPRKQVQSLSSYHWTIPQSMTELALYTNHGGVSRPKIVNFRAFSDNCENIRLTRLDSASKTEIHKTWRLQ